ncbi:MULTISPECIES: osmoprotectant ABC transporter substrate-binding protein [Staphylococcus]|jgi:osmoprotectant transport system substrate-binding protein|uniref:Glycine/betaine ABC transporter periplasmic protein n=1 Tax=Staphylococcus nepalensis TaxID=214473 RepID=A0A291JIK0_9STAP|nr:MULTISPECIES: osmoprotectant ABC transporter substrate-binding protein [Staphylococcus]VDG66233.1 proline/glycine betaine ABC-type transport system, permease component fused to periplasmic component [Lacrimispora indolis]ATH59313.1 glycine/betaine ABC transporter substrate-binding protein [Staphylococcus nepalensis]ATH64406.1 glycine/betaine ABC transporter substrate-binding protein [Staphylococcus nepalensis]AWI43766.1 glycine/betaine ABC transporter substrate-binding protein [Staphylococcu
MKKLKQYCIVLVLCLTVLSGCSLPGLGGNSSEDDVKITALATSESQIMSHMLRLLIEHDTNGKIKPTLINNLGSSTIQHNALVNGDANMSGTRYNGTDLTGALNEDPIKDPKKAMKVTQDGFQKKFDQTFFDSYGFANTYSFMVTKETAEKYNLDTVSDLKKHPELRLGVDSSWLNRKGDGYPGFTQEYGFKFDTIRPMQIGLVYDALHSNNLEVAVGYSTDGRIAAYDLKVLKDDRHFFPPYDASAVATNELLDKHPELKPIIDKLAKKVSTDEMQKLNYQADGEGQEPAVVAEKFLKAHNYFEDDKKGGQN